MSANTLSVDEATIQNSTLTSLVLQAGSAAAPSLAFVGSLTTGLSCATANSLSLDVAGAEIVKVIAAGATLNTGILTVPAGSAAAPSITFAASTTTGLSCATADTLSFDISGAEKAKLSATTLTLTATVVPATTDTNNLGSPSAVWTNVFSKHASGSQVITSGTTFTPSVVYTSTSTRFKFTLIGAGGGGGAAAAATYLAGSGGGAGGTGILYTTGLTPGNAYTIAIGTGGTGGITGGAAATAGGNTTFNDGTTTFTATGGGAGVVAANATTAGGAGGTVSGFSVNIPGQAGGTTAAASVISGSGGSSLFGAGGMGTPVTVVATGVAGSNYGAGGAGGSGASQTGGAGTNGVIIVEWWN